VHVRSLIAKVPLMVRALVLVPLLAAGLDQARVSLMCEPGSARSCLDAAGSGRFGLAGMLLLLGYVLAVAGLVGRLSRGRNSLWLIAIAGLWAALGGQALLADIVGGATLLGGGWMPLLAFAAAGGALLSLALRTARKLLRLSAPRLTVRLEFTLRNAAPAATPPLLRPARQTRGRAPPAFA
jgi:hypothetical protein